MYRYLFFIPLTLILMSCQTPSKGTSDKSEKDGPDVNPKLTKPVVEKIWVPDKIEDDGVTMTGRHWKFLIHRDTTWAE